jgi:hypothetical protein
MTLSNNWPPLHPAHITEVYGLPPIHKDPFDRVLIAEIHNAGCKRRRGEGIPCTGAVLQAATEPMPGCECRSGPSPSVDPILCPHFPNDYHIDPAFLINSKVFQPILRDSY